MMQQRGNKPSPDKYSVGSFMARSVAGLVKALQRKVGRVGTKWDDVSQSQDVPAQGLGRLLVVGVLPQLEPSHQVGTGHIAEAVAGLSQLDG
jgi:hypothetical protein